ncbi:MAG TPA: hypothetical protein VNK91_12195 [Burkholderiaceae bacterium]|nr:hypothetical protein [Burkholderiaceae bacterium]
MGAVKRKWFDVDTDGLAQVVARRGKVFVLYELISNALDAPGTTAVAVTLRPRSGALGSEGTFVAELSVEDDSPHGFADPSAGFTLFAPSERKGNPQARGRFGAGEKLALALFEAATIETVRWSMRFDGRGRRLLPGSRSVGTRVSGVLRVTEEEFDELEKAVRGILVPEGIRLSLNGEVMPHRKPLNTIELTLPTELCDDGGTLRRVRRLAKVHIHLPRDGEQATLYELGIPVVVTGDSFSVDVQTKVPTNLDRDNVSPAYLAKLRAAVLEAMSDTLTSADANAPWVRDAIERHGAAMRPETVRRILDLRFGEKRVSYDPHDREANARAVAAGYAVVYGSQMSAAEWEAARRAEAIRPAGKVTPSPRPNEGPDGNAMDDLPSEKWTPAIRAVVALSERLARRLLGQAVTVRVVCDVTWPFAATYGQRTLTFNLGRLSHGFFEGPLERVLDVLVHELAHEFESNHLSDRYYHALSALAGKLAVLALKEPSLFDVAEGMEPLAREGVLECAS